MNRLLLRGSEQRNAENIRKNIGATELVPVFSDAGPVVPRSKRYRLRFSGETKRECYGG